MKTKLAYFKTPFWAWIGFLAMFAAAGAVAGILVFWKGLSLTNLSDLVPWGLWITIDLSSIALSAGAFMLSAVVYLVGIKKLQPIARTAVFIGLIGYTMALITLLMDIGRPDRFWHAMVFWNPHSVLWEVTMCVALYLTVLVLEVLPIVGEADWFQARFPKIAPKLEHIHKFAPILAIAGLGFSLLHQSSLGATYGVLKARPIWYRPGLSVLFMLSAMVAGPSLTVLASMLVGWLKPDARVQDDLLETVSHFVGWALAAYLYFRFWDAFAMTYTYQPGRNEALSALTSGPFAFNFWIGEILVGAVIPLILLLNPKTRKNKLWRAMALAFVVGGLVAYRWDINLVGQVVLAANLPQGITPLFTEYFPSLIEFLVGFGVIAYGLIAFSLGVKFLNIVDHPPMREEVHSHAGSVIPVAAGD